METGVPIENHVAGVAVGLVAKTDENDPTLITDYRVLTDLLVRLSSIFIIYLSLCLLFIYLSSCHGVCLSDCLSICLCV